MSLDSPVLYMDADFGQRPYPEPMEICNPPEDEVTSANSQGGQGEWVMMDIDAWASEIWGFQYNGEVWSHQSFDYADPEYSEDLDFCIEKLAALDLDEAVSGDGEVWSPELDYADPGYRDDLYLVIQSLEALKLS
ncbi:hypothetical protein BWQ96_03583 [Gracilariopsis chorda]|uniref:Uncharacterized protein n=1 Tax=Gracilariopsis chorda TaxID=448386 RepID=A0A2V3IWR3_9FLOR|nr:hypothetical protein BWQ96_03583 [Gracilariopsis chorda]|eukprot:PXF46594.1 hypothetical protein BWQ96_03583 [Gracilariopsis chorda]